MKSSKKKILIFIHSLRHGGAERIALEINKHLNTKNINSKILTWINDNPYLRSHRYKNAKTIHLINKNKYKWIISLKESLKLLNLTIKKENPDLIHVHSLNVLFLLLLSKYKNNIIFIVHGYAFLETKFFSKLTVFRILMIIFIKFKKVKIVCVSKNLIPFTSKFLFIPKNEISYITNGVNDDFKNKKRKNNINKIKNIIMIGTLSDHKGQYIGVQIFNKLLKISSNHRLYICGDGPDKNKINRFIIANRLKDKIKMIGTTNNIKKYLNNADILWQLSKSEGFPLAVLEAMSAGVPCVAYNVRGTNEIIKNNSNGILVNNGDKDKILKKTIEIFADKKTYKKFSKNSLLDIKKKFNFFCFLNQHYSLIKNTIAMDSNYKIKFLNKIFLSFFPKNYYGDKIFNYIKHFIAHKRIPYIKKNINDVILKIKTSKEILNLARLKTTSKIDVKNFLKNKGLFKYTIPTLQIINNYNQLKKYKFKNNTIIKADHASGLVEFIDNKNNPNKDVYKQWLKLNYYDVSREVNYKNLKKRLLIEPIIFNSKKLIDYKFFCYNGVVKFCQLDINRWDNHTRKFYDKEWNDLNFSILYPEYKLKVKKPKLFKEMLYLSEKIAKNFNSLVRVDMYTNHSKIYIGEITHSPGSGTEHFLPKEKEDTISKLFFN